MFPIRSLFLLLQSQTKAYTPHMDYIPLTTPSDYNFDSERVGGNRYATVLLYMTDMVEGAGGETGKLQIQSDAASSCCPPATRLLTFPLYHKFNNTPRARSGAQCFLRSGPRAATSLSNMPWKNCGNLGMPNEPVSNGVLGKRRWSQPVDRSFRFDPARDGPFSFIRSSRTDRRIPRPCTAAVPS